MFIEAPAQVGFSLGPLKSSDYEQGEENLRALVSFFKKFPDLKDQDLYLAGEGYSGVVVPWTANRTLEWNVSPYTPPYERIRLRGLFLGNPCTHPSECYKQGNNIHSYRFLSNHYYYTRAQYEEFELACMGVEMPGCTDVKKNMDNFFLSTGVNRRNIYEKCLKQHSEGYPDIPCLDQTGILKWLNDEQMRKAMHVNVSTSTKWTVCNEDVELSYLKDPRGSYFLYPSLIQANLRLVPIESHIVHLQRCFGCQQSSHRHYALDRIAQAGSITRHPPPVDGMEHERRQRRRCLVDARPHRRNRP